VRATGAGVGYGPAMTPQRIDGLSSVGVVTLLISAAAGGASFAWWTGRDLSVLLLPAGPLADKPWSLASSAILHGGMVHLVFNLIWFWSLGGRLERAWGPAWLLGLTLLFAAGSAASEHAVGHSAVGLSGVVYGLVTLIWAVQRYDPNLIGSVTRETMKLFVVWFVLCIVLTMLDVLNIANLAHAVGAWLGWSVGKTLLARRRRDQPGLALWGGLLVVTLTLLGIAATVGRERIMVLIG
jgi:membrane associated rhomboid family serine protease